MAREGLLDVGANVRLGRPVGPWWGFVIGMPRIYGGSLTGSFPFPFRCRGRKLSEEGMNPSGLSKMTRICSFPFC
jgi:hypothetical protein